MAPKKKAKAPAPKTIASPIVLGGQTITPADAISQTPTSTFARYEPTMGAPAITTPEKFGMETGPQPIPAGPTVVTGGGTPPPPETGVVPPPPPSAGNTVTGVDALDTFRKTLALIMGEKEASKAYIAPIFNRYIGYQKQGVDQNTALNLVLRDARTDQALAPFRQRFRAILALEDMKVGGKIVDVPTVQEYIKAEEQLGEILNRSELGDLATEDFIADVFSKGKSVKEATDIITTVQARVKNSPASVRQQWQALYPTMTDAQITKAILLGPKGAAELERQAKGLDVRAAAAEAKSLMPTQTEAEELASKGYTYGTSLQGFQNIAGFFPQTQVIAERFKRQPFTAQQAMAYQFGGDAVAKKELETLRGLESGLFQSRTGAASTALGTQTKGIV